MYHDIRGSAFHIGKNGFKKFILFVVPQSKNNKTTLDQRQSFSLLKQDELFCAPTV